MNKVRVYEVARELGLQNRDLVQKIASMGIQVRNHMSLLDAAEVDRVKRALEKEKAASTVEERIRPTVVRRRTVAKKEPAAAPVAARASNGNGAAAAAAPASAHDGGEVEAPVERPQRRPAVKQAPPPSPAPEASAPMAPAAAEGPAPAAAAPAAAVEPTPPPPAPRPARPAPVAEPQHPESEPAPAAASGDKRMPTTPPPASVRFAHANLPPGVVARGSTVAPGVAPLPEAARARIVSEHAARRPDAPRRRELGRAALGPTGRPQAGRPGRKKAAPAGKKGAKTEITVPSAQKRLIRIEDQIQLQQLAQRMSLKATEVLMKLMQLGMSGVHINSTLDADTAKILASEFGYEVENVARSEEEVIQAARGEFADEAAERQERAPIVTVMGHVDHGKTSLLDRIRKADVAAHEAGGITQHIGSYRVDVPGGGSVVFIDTPGHEAFTAMRARGAQVTDIVVLVVAADDGVMPQTREAVNHARAAGVPIVVAVNKIDKPDARPERVKNELAADGLTPEEWGGETIFVECSAISGQGVEQLLESILLQSEILELQANPAIPAEGVVLEAYLDRGRGPVANVLIKNGTLHTGDFVVAGSAWGRIRAMTDDRGKQLKDAGPATPCEVLGLSEVPAAGDAMYVVTDQKKAQEVAESRAKPAARPAPGAARGLDQLQQMMRAGEVQDLNLVIKSDVQGSVEALQKAMTDLSTDKVKVSVVHTGVGGITESDVMLASASNAIIIGFNVRPQGQAASTAKAEGVDIRMYSVIYEAVDDVKKAMAGLLAPKLVEKELGKAEVRQVFSIPKVGTVAGSYVTEGKVQRNAQARLVRDAVQVWQGKIATLRRFKDDAREVAAGYECGITLEGFNDLKERDIIECFEMQEVAPEMA